MSMYFGTTEITNFDNLAPAQGQDITQIFFGSTEVFTVWAEYDGTLPATYSANGSTLADYRIYGAAGGVGDRTTNYHDETLYNGTWINSSFALGDFGLDRYRSTKTFLAAGTYTICFGKTVYLVRQLINGGYAEQSFNAAAYTFTVTADGYVGFSFRNTSNTAWDSDPTTVMIVPGSTAPAEYVPYGYAVPMSVSDGTTSTTTQIYIGDTQLGEDEYVDYGEGKVYRMVNGVLTPTDPPVPLPALPTIDGTNITDYAGQSAAVPSRFTAKYRKEGF